MLRSWAALRESFARSSPLQHIANAPALVAVRESLPWSFLGLLAALPVFVILVPPRPFAQRLSAAELPSFAIMAAALVAILSYKLAVHLRVSRALLIGGAALAFLLSLPHPHGNWIAYLRAVGSSGLFLAMLLALCVAGLCVLLRRAGLLAQGAALVLFAGSLAAIAASGHAPSDALTALLQPLGRLGDSYAALMTIVALETLLWTIGVHGPATLAAVITPVYLTLQMQNTAAYGHAPLPHIVVVSIFLFIFPGGAGATLPLAALLLFSRTKRLRTLARATIGPALCNINEPLLFGLPIVGNPYLVTPFVIAPLVTATLTYFAIAHAIVSRPAFYIPGAVPTFVATYLATLDPRAVALAAVNIAVATAIYAPFVAALDRAQAPA